MEGLKIIGTGYLGILAVMTVASFIVLLFFAYGVWAICRRLEPEYPIIASC